MYEYRSLGDCAISSQAIAGKRFKLVCQTAETKVAVGAKLGGKPGKCVSIMVVLLIPCRYSGPVLV
jgi:hypothetical protein